jgi:hypothetical protein
MDGRRRDSSNAIKRTLGLVSATNDGTSFLSFASPTIFNSSVLQEGRNHQLPEQPGTVSHQDTYARFYGHLP